LDAAIQALKACSYLIRVEHDYREKKKIVNHGMLKRLI
jgi:hypothetical protein